MGCLCIHIIATARDEHCQSRQYTVYCLSMEGQYVCKNHLVCHTEYNIANVLSYIIILIYMGVCKAKMIGPHMQVDNW